MTQQVGPVGVAVFGGPEPCPQCGDALTLAFGETVDDKGRRQAVIDYSVARCRRCRKTFPVRHATTPVNE